MWRDGLMRSSQRNFQLITKFRAAFTNLMKLQLHSYKLFEDFYIKRPNPNKIKMIYKTFIESSQSQSCLKSIKRCTDTMQ